MTSGPRLNAVLRTAVKQDREPHENEDSVAANTAEGRFAISDGVSTAARSEIWSALLTDAFVRGDDPVTPTVLTRLRRAWWDAVHEPDLPWFAHAKLAQGAAATFVGLQVDRSTYRITAVGDSCVLHLRERELVLAAPLHHWTGFSRFTETLSTDPERPGGEDQVWSGGGEFATGDVLLLATDAVARHLLHRYADEGVLPPIWEHVGDDAEFSDFVRRERARGLDNDDSTVCVVWT